jgi:hypothetical protein
MAGGTPTRRGRYSSRAKRVKPFSNRTLHDIHLFGTGVEYACRLGPAPKRMPSRVKSCVRTRSLGYGGIRQVAQREYAKGSAIELEPTTHCATTQRVWVFRLDNGGSRSVPSPPLHENMS